MYLITVIPNLSRLGSKKFYSRYIRENISSFLDAYLFLKIYVTESSITY